MVAGVDPVSVVVHDHPRVGDSKTMKRFLRSSPGPHRVVPLSLLAQQYPEVLADLRKQTSVPPQEGAAAQFVQQGRRAQRPLYGGEATVLKRLAKGPVSLATVVRESRLKILELRRIERLVLRAGFTPDGCAARACAALSVECRGCAVGSPDPGGAALLRSGEPVP